MLLLLMACAEPIAVDLQGAKAAAAEWVGDGHVRMCRAFLAGAQCDVVTGSGCEVTLYVNPSGRSRALVVAPGQIVCPGGATK